MNKLDVTSSQSRAREELVEDDIWNDMEENIWAEIFRDKNGDAILRDISSDNSMNSESNLENIMFEETCFEVLRNLSLFFSILSKMTYSLATNVQVATVCLAVIKPITRCVHIACKE